VPVIIRVQPSVSGTSTRFVHNKIKPPSLVIDDGTTTLVFSPASIAGGLAEAAEFAQNLAQVASEWQAGCRRALAAAESEDPCNVGTLLAEYGRPSLGDRDRA
jgi:hypothetical protein